MFPKLETRPWLVRALQPTTASIRSSFWPLPILLHTAGRLLWHPCSETLWRTLTVHSFHSYAHTPHNEASLSQVPMSWGRGWDGSVERECPSRRASRCPPPPGQEKGCTPRSRDLPLSLFLVNGCKYTSMGTWFEGPRSTLESVRSVFASVSLDTDFTQIYYWFCYFGVRE